MRLEEESWWELEKTVGFVLVYHTVFVYLFTLLDLPGLEPCWKGGLVIKRSVGWWRRGMSGWWLETTWFTLLDWSIE